MTTARKLLPALSTDALLGKSKLFIGRAIRSKTAGGLDEYQLWASLALELLGKAALAQIHPSLIIDPTHHISLFAASGISLGTDVKTIAWHTLFDRLRHLSPRFDENVKRFCDGVALRRNAELHSGEAPFQAMKLEAWEGRYWRSTQVILEIMDSSLEEWMGAAAARAPKAIVTEARRASVEAAKIRTEDASKGFKTKPKKERERLLSLASAKTADDYTGSFRVSGDEVWQTSCPSCTADAFLTGLQYEEEVIGQTGGSYSEDHYD